MKGKDTLLVVDLEKPTGSARQRKIRQLDEELNKIAGRSDGTVVYYLQVRNEVEEIENMSDEEYLESGYAKEDEEDD